MKILKTLAVVAALSVANSVMANTINGSINFAGIPSINTASYGTATAFTSFTNVHVDGIASGDYSSVPTDYGSPHAGQSITYNPFSFNPASTPIIPLWSFTISGVTYSFDLTSLTIDSQTSSGVHLIGSGIAHITGFDPSAGEWDLSAGKVGGTFHFSAANSVPDGGATAILLGVSLLGMGALRRKVS